MMDTGLRLKAELISGRSQLAGLRQTYGEDNPRVRTVEARNAELQRQIDQMGGLDQQPVPNHDSKTGTYPSARELPTLGLTYFDLQRKVQVQESLWEVLTRQYEAARIQEAEETPSARVFDVAEVPERKSGPSRRGTVMIGAMLSFFVACISVVAMNIWDGMDPQDEPKKLIVEVVDSIMDTRRWYWSLPGMKWIHARAQLHGSLDGSL
jgi:capsule polysaccharide export protein KpsE/RkpR